MSLTDYLNLGLASIKAHKGRAFSTIIIVGLLFSIITASTLILQGLENAVLGKMLEPTNGKVLTISSIDLQTCGEICNLDTEITQIKANINKYGGKILDTKITPTEDSTLQTDGTPLVELSPNRASIDNLSLTHVGQNKNPLNLILEQIKTGSNYIPALLQTEEAVFAEFPDIKTAYDYYKDDANYCSEIDHAFNTCNDSYRYKVTAAISSPLEAYGIFQSSWRIFNIAAIILSAIALIVTLTTYARLINKDLNVISYYYMMGATKNQIRAIYTIYLLALSLLAVAFSLLVGLTLATILSLVNMSALQQVFALGLGILEGNIWLIGWNNLILYLSGIIPAAAILAIILGNSNFKAKRQK